MHRLRCRPDAVPRRQSCRKQPRPHRWHCHLPPERSSPHAPPGDVLQRPYRWFPLPRAARRVGLGRPPSEPATTTATQQVGVLCFDSRMSPWVYERARQIIEDSSFRLRRKRPGLPNRSLSRSHLEPVPQLPPPDARHSSLALSCPLIRPAGLKTWSSREPSRT